jgi:hypothetical protein
VECLFIHKTDHQDAVGLVVLDDGGDQAVLLAEIQFHRRYQQKSPPGRRRVSHSCSEIDQNAADRPVIRW